MASRYDLNAKTVAKWRKRTTVEDARMGPHQPHSTVLTTEQEAMIVAFRKQTLLPLDDCLYALQASIPNLTRSSLHRCLQRHGISRLPQVGEKPAKKKFAQYPIGYFHLGLKDARTHALGETEHVNHAHHARLHGLDRIVLIVDGRGGAREVINLIDFEQDGFDYVMAHEFKAMIIQKVRDVFAPPCKEVIEADDFMPVTDQPLTKV
jgi:hypothetical protein